MPTMVRRISGFGRDIAAVASDTAEFLAHDGAALIERSNAVDDHYILALASELGNLDLDVDEVLSGPKVMQIRHDPSKAGSDGRPAYFTQNEFPLHTDMAYVPNPPRFLLMQCVTPDPTGNGVSLVASCSAAFAKTGPQSREMLEQPIFTFLYPPNCPIGESTKHAVHQSRFDGEIFRFRRDSMQIPLDAVLAVDEFENAVYGEVHAVLLNQGELIVLDNRRVAHGRTEFSALSPRHLRRAYAR